MDSTPWLGRPIEKYIISFSPYDSKSAKRVTILIPYGNGKFPYGTEAILYGDDLKLYGLVQIQQPAPICAYGVGK
jgi:hypothetical protein